MSRGLDKIDYHKLIEKDDSCIHIIRFICKLGYDKPKEINSNEQIMAFNFFGRHATTSITLNNIFWPEKPMNISEEVHNNAYLDFPSAYVLIRNLYENYLVLRYLLNMDMKPEERRLRKLIWDRTALYDKIKFGELLQSKPKKIAPFKKKFRSLTRSLEKNRLFLDSIKVNQRKAIVNCRERNLLKFDKMAVEAKINENYHRSIYGYCNSYAHPNSHGYEHFVSGNPQFLINQAKNRYKEISVLLLDFIKNFIFKNEIENQKDGFLHYILHFYIGLINNFDIINEKRQKK